MFPYGVCLKVWTSAQNVIARSAGEAELYAAVRGAAEGMGLRSMVGDLGLEMKPHGTGSLEAFCKLNTSGSKRL